MELKPTKEKNTIFYPTMQDISNYPSNTKELSYTQIYPVAVKSYMAPAEIYVIRTISVGITLLSILSLFIGKKYKKIKLCILILSIIIILVTSIVITNFENF